MGIFILGPKRLVIALFAIALCYLAFEMTFRETINKVEVSPDGSMRVEIYRVPWLRLKPAPGASGDAPVVVYVKDSTGRILAKWTDLMMQNAGPIEWFDDHVAVGPEIAFFPREPKGKAGAGK